MAAGVGLLVGGATAFGGPVLAAGLAGAIAVAIAVGIRPSIALALLAASMYFESVTIGGLTISRFVAVGALGIAMAEAFRRRATLPFGLPMLLTIAYVAWLTSSLFWAVDFSKTSSGLMRLGVSLLYTLAFAVLLRSRRSLDIALMGLVLGALVTGFASMVEFAAGDFNYSGGREEGLVGDPNFFAGYAIFAYPVILALIAEARTLGRRVLLIAALIAVIGAVFTTLSRGGLLALTIVTVIILLSPARSLFRSFGQKTLASLFVGVGVAIALVVSLGSLDTRIQSLFGGEEAAGSGRLNFWKAAWLESQQHPFTGVGFGGFDTVSNELVKRTPGVDLTKFDLRPQGTLVHSVYLGSLAEVGLIGLILYISVVVATGVALRRTARRAAARGDPGLARIVNGLVLGLIGWSIASIFLSSETSRPVWILVGMALALPRLLPPPPEAPPGR